jgi:formylglycine-generating enzyme required for sulfatase activity
VLQPAALWLHRQEGRTRASADELAPVLEPALQATQWREGDARQFLKTIRDESGLLTGWSHAQYGFMHLGFQEYLAACELRRLALAEALASGQPVTLAELASHYGESWWQEVILLMLAQGNPSLFGPFMAEALKQPCFAEESAFLDLIVEEAAEFSVGAFVAVLEQEPGTDPAFWANQLAALRVLLRMAPDKIGPLVEKLGNHPLLELRDLILNFAKATSPAPTVSVRIDAQTEAPTIEIKIRSAPPGSRRNNNGNVELLLIPGGRFIMGSPDGEGHYNERPAHEVEIRPFYLGRYPVTNEEYARCLKANQNLAIPFYWADRRFNRARQPVVGVDWESARRFATWAGGRLPSEAEWEYAARAGSTSRYFWGDSDAKAGDYAWFFRNAEGATHPVGEKRPNDFGLYDMAGNVWEWTQDYWHDNYRGAPCDGAAWEDGYRECRGLRGGSMFDFPQYLRSAYRSMNQPNVKSDYLGFRLAHDL